MWWLKNSEQTLLGFWSRWQFLYLVYFLPVLPTFRFVFIELWNKGVTEEYGTVHIFCIHNRTWTRIASLFNGSMSDACSTTTTTIKCFHYPPTSKACFSVYFLIIYLCIFHWIKFFFRLHPISCWMSWMSRSVTGQEIFVRLFFYLHSRLVASILTRDLGTHWLWIFVRIFDAVLPRHI